eukprot:TRINITY_DN724_c0_g1_i6.p1 TRINITY_DN724_c0_g1~~TRINITY_DN724_c0_g1_i6.p1  ORF type:complete len:634 (+),score=70.26 TRINITY_DN724_c0_g1_i6:8090-9991(+)
MGIGTPISVIGYVHLTKGMNCKSKSEKLSKILPAYPSCSTLSPANLQEIFKKLHPESELHSAPDSIPRIPEDSAVERIFFAHFGEGMSVNDLLLKYAVAFEWNQGALLDIMKGGLDGTTEAELVKTIVEFTLKDLSNIIIISVEESLRKGNSTVVDKMRLAGLIIKIHKMYQRLVSTKAFDSVFASMLSFINSQGLVAPLAYKVYCFAGEYLKLEQRYHNPRSPLIPSHVLAQQKVMAALPFWTQDASSLYGFLKFYLDKLPLSLKDQSEVAEVLFYENKELSKIFMEQFIKEDKLDFENFMWACISCCMDPRETFRNCLWEYLQQNRDPAKVREIIRKIAEFSIYKLGKMSLKLPGLNQPTIDSINKLIKISEAELDTVIYTVFPMLKEEEVMKLEIHGDDSLAYRIIDTAATVLKIRGKTIEGEENVIPLHLLPCSSLIRELKFSQMDSIDVYNSMNEHKELAEKIGNADFIAHFFDIEKNCVDIPKINMACTLLCLDQGNTFAECFWKTLCSPETAEKKTVVELVLKMTGFVVNEIPEIVLPQLSEYPQLVDIQKKYQATTEADLIRIAEKVMPFMKLDSLKKTDLQFNIGDQRLAYTILDSAAEVLGIPIEINSIQFVHQLLYQCMLPS